MPNIILSQNLFIMSASPLPTLFLIEAVLKVIGGSIFYFSPSTILKQLQVPPYPQTSLSLIQSLGTQTLAFSIPLFLTARSDEKSCGCRRLVYWMMLGREGLLAAGLLGQIGWSYVTEWGSGDREGVGRKKGEKDARRLEEGMKISGSEEGVEEEAVQKLRRGLWLWVVELTPFVLGRIWVLGWRGEWFV
ncbi:hypothetical protein CC78DRAFT_569372 [Lojkania enalia]|uniref:Uncharacterized protein n=1 Tax=Lojkania enalia TaxID=147567 RepID=A0A9P4N7U4_9PLEO|nr:hypothetical protein CC78DRAFT_569372 [Didymosphaeria enalia]